MSSRKPRLSVEQKLKVLQHLEDGMPVAAIAEKFNVLPRTVTRIQKNAKNIVEFAEQGDNMRDRQSLQKPKNVELDNRLYEWIRQQEMLDKPISDLLLQEKAMELSKEIATTSNFKASRGWLQKFKDRRGIRLRNIYSEAGIVDEQEAAKFVKYFEKRISEENINLENVYNMGEAGLVWKSMPTKTLTSKEHKIERRKVQKDRVTVGVCANVPGTNKLKLMLINKYANPRVLKDCKNNLPVFFKNQPNSWVDRAIFNEWYQNVFKASVGAYRREKGIHGKVILLVDNCKWHLVDETDTDTDNFEVLFLPPNTAAVLQPMNLGIILKIKRLYRHKVLQRILNYRQGLNDFYKLFNIKDCIDLLSKAWENVTESSIKSSWTKLLPNLAMGGAEKVNDQDLRLATSEGTEEGFTEVGVQNFLSSCEEEEECDSKEESDIDNDSSEINNDDEQEVEQEQRDETDENETRKEIEYLFERLQWHARDKPYFVTLSLSALRETFLHFS